MICGDFAMDIELIGVGNPGWTFTLKRMNQISAFFDFINTKRNDEEFNYQKFQDEITIFSNELDDSKVRMFVPWFERFKILNSKDRISTYGEWLTEEGERFASFCPMYVQLMENKENFSQKEIEVVKDMQRAFIYSFLVELLSNDRGGLYKQILKTIDKYGYLTKDEFFIVTTKFQKELSDQWLDDTIMQYRGGELTIDLKNIKNKNSYGYIVPFLEEAGVVTLDNEKRVCPNREHDFYEGVIKLL